MALSNMTIVSDGNLEFVSISFNYLDRSEINVYFDSVPNSTWAWVGDTNQIKFTPEVPNGVTVHITRVTDASDLRHTFSEGAAFTAKTLDEDLRQVLHIVQEAKETNLAGDFYSDIDMHNNKVTNLAPGSNPSDAVTFQQLQDLSPDAGLRVELAKDYANTGSGIVGFRQDVIGTVGRSVESKLRDTISVKDFGAVGDGVTDDTTAIQEAVSSGRPLEWLNLTYRITETISHTYTTAINWRSSGATLLFDPPSPKREALNLAVNAVNHRIEGEFSIDANLKAFIGLYLLSDSGTQYPQDYADFYADGLRVSNVYRSSTAYSGGDGIWIRGAYKTVELIRPQVSNCRMAPGAGTPGSQGIFGITFSPNTSGGYPVIISITDPYIASILSEDNTYYMDQDGIRVVTTPDSLHTTLNQFTVRGGLIRNCYGRSIKVQSEYALIDGVRFDRNQGFDRGYGNEEIDFQEGGGIVTGCQATYRGTAPSRFVRYVPTRQAGKSAYPASVILQNTNLILDTGSTLPAVVTSALGGGDVTTTKYTAVIDNVNVFGPGELTNFVNWNVGNAGDGFHMRLRNCQAAPTGAWVLCGSGPGNGSLHADNLIHTGNIAGFLRASSSGNFRPKISANNLINFVRPKRADNTETPTGGYLRIGSFTAMDQEGNVGGLFTPLTYTLTDGETVTLPHLAVTVSTCLLLFSANNSKTTQGIFSCDSAGVISLTPEATAITVGTTSDPGSGIWRIWSGGTGAGPVIKNATGSTRIITVLLMG